MYFYILDSKAGGVGDIIRNLFFEINQTLFKFIASLYDFLITIAAQTQKIATDSPITSYTENIYVLVGLIMLFRMAIVLLKYIADPDKSDKSGEGGKMVSHTIIVLILLIFTPTMFTWLYSLQTAIFSSNFFTNMFVASSVGGTANSVLYNDPPGYNASDKVCTYALDNTTNKLCFKYPGLVSESGNTILEEGEYKYTDNTYNFCPSGIVVNATTDVVKLIKGSESIVYTGSKSGIKKILDLEKSDSCAIQTTALDSYTGIQFLIPTKLTGFSTVYTNSFTQSCDSVTAKLDCNMSELSLKLVQTNSWIGENEANYKLTTATADQYKTDHPYSMTYNPNTSTSVGEVFENNAVQALLDQKTGSKFADTIMLSFLTPADGYYNEDGTVNTNSPYDAAPFSTFTEQKELLASDADYSVAANQVDYGVVSKLVVARNPDNTDYYAFGYNYLLGTIAAIVVIVMMLATLFKAAIRVFKLLALQIIAPIPIVLYLDPNAKAGNSSLEKWFKALFTTYADLFVRILVIMFVGVMIGDIALAMDGSGPLLYLFTLFGAFMFMNIAPEFILSLFGIKAEGGSFNPLKQLASAGALGAVTGAGLSAMSGGALGALRNVPSGIRGGNLGGAMLAGLKSGGATGAKTGGQLMRKGGSFGSDGLGAVIGKNGEENAKKQVERMKAKNDYDIAKNKAAQAGFNPNDLAKPTTSARQQALNMGSSKFAGTANKLEAYNKQKGRYDTQDDIAAAIVNATQGHKAERDFTASGGAAASSVQLTDVPTFRTTSDNSSNASETGNSTPEVVEYETPAANESSYAEDEE